MKLGAQSGPVRSLLTNDLGHPVSSTPWVWVTLLFPLWPSRDTGERCSGELRPGRLQTQRAWHSSTREWGAYWPRGARCTSAAWMTSRRYPLSLLSPEDWWSWTRYHTPCGENTDFHTLSWSLVFQIGPKKWKRFNFTPCWLPLSLVAAQSSWRPAKLTWLN